MHNKLFINTGIKNFKKGNSLFFCSCPRSVLYLSDPSGFGSWSVSKELLTIEYSFVRYRKEYSISPKQDSVHPYLLYIEKSFEKVGIDLYRYSGFDILRSIIGNFHKNRELYLSTRRLCAQNYGSRKTTKTTRVKMAMRQTMLGGQTACMCVSVDKQHACVSQ